MNLVKFKIAPADAAEEVLAIADLVTRSKGGQGVIYEVLKYFLRDRM
jgi:3-deoxy-D-manno-octulosonate 8-phosphate phosphatase KdsC-like HAD superfamily phosphatase